MSTNATSLVASIKTRLIAVLGSEYSELGYVADLSKNTFKGGSKRFGVRVLGQTEVTTVTRHSTIDQEFEIVLTGNFINSAMSDSQEQALAPFLQDLAFDVYRDLIATKCGLPSVVLNVTNFSSSAPEKLPDSTVAIVSKITVKYRAQI